MRHLRSLLVSALVGVGVYLCLGLGAERWRLAERQFDGGERSGWWNLAAGVALLVLAGIGWTALLVLRWSPVGTGLLGLAFTVLAVLSVAGPDGVVRFLPERFLGLDGARSAPPAVCLVLAVPLVATVLSPRRWGRPRHRRLSEHPIDAPM